MRTPKNIIDVLETINVELERRESELIPIDKIDIFLIEIDEITSDGFANEEYLFDRIACHLDVLDIIEYDEFYNTYLYPSLSNRK